MAGPRGIYRSVHCVLYDCPEFIALSTDAKLALHLLKLTREAPAAGIYRLYEGLLVERNPSWTMRTVRRVLDELESTGWIVRRDGLVWVRNGLRYEPGYNLEQHEKRLGVLNHLDSLPRSSLIRDFCVYYGLPVPDGLPPGPQAAPPTPQDMGATRPSPDPRPGVTRPPAGAGTGTGSGTGSNSTGRLAPAVLDRWFDESFWPVYPRKTKKADARKAMRRLNPDAALRERMIAAVRAQSNWPQWQKVDAEGVHAYIPHPATWLNGERWDDEPPPAGGFGGGMTDAERRFRGGR